MPDLYSLYSTLGTTSPHNSLIAQSILKMWKESILKSKKDFEKRVDKESSIINALIDSDFEALSKILDRAKSDNPYFSGQANETCFYNTSFATKILNIKKLN